MCVQSEFQSLRGSIAFSLFPMQGNLSDSINRMRDLLGGIELLIGFTSIYTYQTHQFDILGVLTRAARQDHQQDPSAGRGEGPSGRPCAAGGVVDLSSIQVPHIGCRVDCSSRSKD